MIRTISSLHSGRASEKTLSSVSRICVIPKPLPPDRKYDAVFVDAPHVLEPVDLTGHGVTFDTFEGVSAASEDPALKPRAWYKAEPTRTRTDGLEESLAYLRDTLKTQRFEVRRQRWQWRGMIPCGC